MQNEIICTGKTIELAIEQGLAELGLSRDDVSVEILETPVKRLFKSTPAKVKLTRDVPLPVKEEKPAPVEQQKPVQQKNTAQKAENVQKKPAPKQEAKKARPASERPTRSSTPRTEEELATLNKKTELASGFLSEVFTAMELEGVTINTTAAERGAILNISGENLSSLIGKRGETMEALSYLTSLVANSIGGSFEKMSLDVAGYREKREADLGELAKRIANNVLGSGRPYALEPMNPYERRIIHTAIGEIEGVASESQGDGERRHIVIFSEAEGLTGNIRYSDRGRRGPKRDGGGGRNRRDRNDRDRNDRGRGDRDRDRRPKQPPIVSTRTEKVDDDSAKPLFSKIEL